MNTLPSRLALAVVAAALVLDVSGFALAHASPGWTVAWRDERLLVVDVEPLGRADQLGVAAGDVIVTVDGRLPVETDVPSVISGRIEDASVMTRANARATEQTGVIHDYVGTLTIGFAETQLERWGRGLAVLAVCLLAGLLVAFRAWRPSGPLHDWALLIAASMSVPLLVFSAVQLGIFVMALLGAILGAASLAILTLAMAGPRDARLRATVIGGSVVTAGAALVPHVSRTVGTGMGLATILGVGLGLVGLALGAGTAWAWRRRDPTDVLAQTEILFAGVAVGTAWISLALSSDAGFFLLPLAGWILIAGLAGVLVVKPLMFRTNRALLERDIFAEALEAQRAAIAADLHDDALQDLTHLVRRLDDRGDREDAELARDVANRLRDLTYELRLPLLDDLGTGSAIEWFVTRLQRMRGVKIGYEQDETGRPPPEVELAFFRVAQEALTNAVKHGRQPVALRYESGDEFATLSVQDGGPGIRDDVPLAGARHFGLMSMRQRAEAVGARLEITRGVQGGTRVEMEWGAT